MSHNILPAMQRSLATLPQIAAQHYRIAAKGAGIIPLNFTTIQLRILITIQMLLEKRSTVALNIVKPRQIMATTFLNAMEFKLSYDLPGLRTLVITHRSAISQEIFENIKRFQEQMPDNLRLASLQNNDRKLEWKNLSAVNVGTAGQDSARGFPCLILELSELGRFKDRHVRDIQESAMCAHATAEKGSMLLNDSTSGGEGNFFHEIAMKGYRNPMSSYYTQFIGWQEMPDYRMTPPPGWVPDSEEVRLMRDLKVDVEQIYWRHVKLHDHMRGIVSAFNREFPASIEEAFSSAEGRLVDSVVMINALNSKTEIDPTAPKILGVDPAGKGDRTALVKRQGWVMPSYKCHNKMDAMTLAMLILEEDKKENFDHVFIDMGYGHGTFDILWKMGFKKITGVYFGGKATDTRLYADKRTEMAAHFQDWIEEGPDGMGGTAKIPDDKDFTTDIRMIPDLEFTGEGQKFKLATKEQIKDLLGKSPDIFDAAILTFAAPVKSQAMREALVTGTVQQQHEPSMLVTDRIFDELANMTGSHSPQPNTNYWQHSFGQVQFYDGYGN